MSDAKYTDNKLVLFGGVGAVIAALCCFTPVLVVGLTAIGAAAVLAYLDFVLIPLLILFAAMLYVGFRQVRNTRCELPAPPSVADRED